MSVFKIRQRHLHRTRDCVSASSVEAFTTSEETIGPKHRMTSKLRDEGYVLCEVHLRNNYVLYSACSNVTSVEFFAALLAEGWLADITLQSCFALPIPGTVAFYHNHGNQWNNMRMIWTRDKEIIILSKSTLVENKTYLAWMWIFRFKSVRSALRDLITHKSCGMMRLDLFLCYSALCCERKTLLVCFKLNRKN